MITSAIRHYLLITFLSCLSVISASAIDGSIHSARIQKRVDETGRIELFAQPASKVSGQAKLMGYTDKAVPEGIDMPEGLKDWIKEVERATEYAETHPEAILGTEALKLAPSTTIAPLLGSIEWDQGAPFSSLCPAGTPVGCVATAMAQVMYYWKYPAQGHGSRTWNYGGINHHVDFGATTYNWNLMYDKHRSYHNAQQNAEVAKLSYHCGVSTDMAWAPGGSGTYLERIPYALVHYFGYNPRMGSAFRSDYNYYEWNDLIMNELNAGRPVLFSGASDSGGHAFVIDGRNAQGFYHVNWGWDGYYNGYYDICILNPDGTGTGASPSRNGYSSDQTAIIGVCPEETGEQVSPLRQSGIQIYDDNLKDITLFMFNTWNDYVSATAGLELINCETSDTIYQFNQDIHFAPLYVWSRDGNSYYQRVYQRLNTSKLPDGNYHVNPCFKWNDRDSCILYPSHPYYMYKNLVYAISGHEVTDLTFDDMSDFGLRVDEVTPLPDTIALGHPYTFTATITNPGSDRFTGTLSYYYAKLGNSNNAYETDPVEVTLAPGQTKTLSLPFEIDEDGDWAIAMIAYSFNYDEAWQLDPGEVHHVSFTPESPSQPYLISAPTILTERLEAEGEASFLLQLGNKGGNFADEIQIKFFKTKACTGEGSLTIGQRAELPLFCSGESVTVNGYLTGLKGMTKYYALPYYVDAHGISQCITYEDSDTKPTPIEVKVYNASGIETIECDDTESVPTFDLLGRKVSNGSFLIRQGQVIISR